MLLTKEVKIRLNSRTKKHYKNLGYDITKNPIIVKVEHLTKGATVKVEVQCECCNTIRITDYYTYMKSKYKNKGDYCLTCVLKYKNPVKLSGKNNPNWNPNLTEEERDRNRIYEGKKEFIKKVLARDNYTCQCCGKSKSNNMEVHHLDGYNWCKEKRSNETNGVTLCCNCHKNFHSIYGRGNNTKEQFEEWIGQAVELLKYEGELPTARKVYCIEENKIYDSVCVLAEEWGIKSNSLIYAVCNHKQKSNGCYHKNVKSKHILWLDEYEQCTEEDIQRYLDWCKIEYKSNSLCVEKPVLCITTNKKFDSIKEACKYYKIKSHSMISDCLRGRQKTTMGILEDGTKVRLQWSRC